MENSAATAGRATFMDEPINGVRNPARVETIRATRFVPSS
jgi:hypothetical protein